TISSDWQGSASLAGAAGCLARAAGSRAASAMDPSLASRNKFCQHSTVAWPPARARIPHELVDTSVINCCYAVNALATLAYLGLMTWGFVAEPPAGLVLAIFAPWALAPYAITAAMARWFAGRPVALAVLSGVSLVSGALAFYVDYHMVLAMHAETVAVSQGA